MKKEEILAVCLEEIRSGKSTIEECTTRYPELGKELFTLLEIAGSVKPYDVTPTPEFKQRGKRYLFEKMQQEPLAKVSGRPRFWPEQTWARVIASLVVALVIIGAAGGSTVYAAQSSLPGDPLYGVKIGVENLQLAVTTDKIAKANLHLDFAQKRIDEVTQQVKTNVSVNAQAAAAVQQQLDDALKQLGSSDNTAATNDTLSRITAATLDQQLQLQQVMANAKKESQPVLTQIIEETKRGNTIAQAAYANHDLLASQPSVADSKLDAGQVTVSGILLSIHDNTWNVGGTVIKNVHFSGKEPATGSKVVIQGLAKGDNFFISQIQINQEPANTTTVEGQYQGTNPDGTANISGLPVTTGTAGVITPTPGDNVQLQSGTSDNNLNVTDKQSGNDTLSSTISGTLTAVDTAKGTITVKVTGNLFTINVNGAQIQNKNNKHQTLELTDLKQLTGQDVKISGLSKKNNILYANLVQIDAGKISNDNSPKPTTTPAANG